MSKSNRRDDHEGERTCAHKVGYHSEAAATRAMVGVRTHIDEWASTKFPSRVYYCDSGSSPCFLFHLSSAPQRSAPMLAFTGRRD